MNAEKHFSKAYHLENEPDAVDGGVDQRDENQNRSQSRSRKSVIVSSNNGNQSSRQSIVPTSPSQESEPERDEDNQYDPPDSRDCDQPDAGQDLGVDSGQRKSVIVRVNHYKLIQKVDGEI